MFQLFVVVQEDIQIKVSSSYTKECRLFSTDHVHQIAMYRYCLIRIGHLIHVVLLFWVLLIYPRLDPRDSAFLLTINLLNCVLLKMILVTILNFVVLRQLFKTSGTSSFFIGDKIIKLFNCIQFLLHLGVTNSVHVIWFRKLLKLTDIWSFGWFFNKRKVFNTLCFSI